MWTMAVVIPAVFLWITAFIALIWYVIVVIPTLNLAFRIPMYIFLIVMIILDVYLVGSFFTNFRKTPEEFAKERG
jgi:carbon starvation protein